MTTLLSTPLTEPPGFLSTISMVADDGSEIVRSLTAAERKSPSVYNPSRDIFCATLEGDLSFEQAMTQARALKDDTERKCAIAILKASEAFLRKQSAAPIGSFPPMQYRLPNGLLLNVSPVWHRRTTPERLMILHFWQKPLTDWQLKAACAVIQITLAQQQPEYLSYGLDFISVPFPEGASRRRFEHYDWSKIKRLGNADLERFWRQFLTGWATYQHREPREVRRRRAHDMFDPPRCR